MTDASMIAKRRAGRIGAFWGQLDWPLRIAVLMLVLFVAVAVFGPWISPYDPLKGSLRARRVPPCWQEGGSWGIFWEPTDWGATFFRASSQARGFRSPYACW